MFYIKSYFYHIFLNVVWNDYCKLNNMRKAIKYLLLGLIPFFLSGCSQCYECTYEVEIDNNGTTQTQTSDPEEYCTVTGEEITELENDGYTCL